MNQYDMHGAPEEPEPVPRYRRRYSPDRCIIGLRNRIYSRNTFFAFNPLNRIEMGRVKCLNPNLWSEDNMNAKHGEYQSSEPYRHLVVRGLMDDNILGKVKDELQSSSILSNTCPEGCVIATLKETDIYKVYQTGDLANLGGLEDHERYTHAEKRSQLSNLSTLRDALYSLEFRKLVSRWTRVGPLSSSSIDLSVNAYGHTGHLLCHDDVIGSRRVSYILYLVGDDWNSGEKEDGGALQLYPLANPDIPGTPALIPSKSIPPKWNQLALFAVDPGRSFHDVQEVYNEAAPRLSISGWFHRAKESELDEWTKDEISQGVEHDRFFDSKQSSLAQLEGGPFHGEVSSELPCASSRLRPFQEPTTVIGSEQLSNWISKEYLDIAATEQCAKAFEDNGSNIQLHKFFHKEAAEKVLLAIKAADKRDKLGYQERTPFGVGVGNGWEPAGPPHRQRFLRLSELTNRSSDDVNDDDDDAAQVLRQVCEVLSSRAFMLLVQRITGLTLISQRTQARRFRPDDDKEYKEAAWAQDEVGGYHTYVDANEENSEENSKSEGQGKNDPAVYDAGDNGPLLSVSAASNALSLVLRDAGVISFVKYVSSAAPGSRFDVVGEYSVDASEEEDGTSESVNGSKGDIEATARRQTEHVHDDVIPGSSTQATKKTRHNE